jgi:hypothetical protein
VLTLDDVRSGKSTENKSDVSDTPTEMITISLGACTIKDRIDHHYVSGDNLRSLVPFNLVPLPPPQGARFGNPSRIRLRNPPRGSQVD